MRTGVGLMGGHYALQNLVFEIKIFKTKSPCRARREIVCTFYSAGMKNGCPVRQIPKGNHIKRDSSLAVMSDYWFIQSKTWRLLEMEVQKLTGFLQAPKRRIDGWFVSESSLPVLKTGEPPFRSPELIPSNTALFIFKSHQYYLLLFVKNLQKNLLITSFRFK